MIFKISFILMNYVGQNNCFIEWPTEATKMQYFSGSYIDFHFDVGIFVIDAEYM